MLPKVFNFNLKKAAEMFCFVNSLLFFFSAEYVCNCEELGAAHMAVYWSGKVLLLNQV